MTGTHSMIALAVAVFVVFFIAKLILRLAGRPVVKNYVTVPPPYPPPTYYPITSPVIPLPYYPQQGPPAAPAENTDTPAPDVDRQPEPRLGDLQAFDEAFDDLVRDYYER